MTAAYLSVTLLTAIANGYAALKDFRGDKKVLTSMHRLSIPEAWLPALGTLKALGAIYLILGIFIPYISLITAISLCIFFAVAIFAHLRAADRGFGAAVVFLMMAMAMVILSILRLQSGNCPR